MFAAVLGPNKHYHLEGQIWPKTIDRALAAAHEACCCECTVVVDGDSGEHINIFINLAFLIGVMELRF